MKLQGDAPVSEDGQELSKFLLGTLDSGSDGITATTVVTKHVTKVTEGWDYLEGDTIQQETQSDRRHHSKVLTGRTDKSHQA